MTLQAKIIQATNLIERVLEQYRKPCLLCSFGKDSVVLLWILRNWYDTTIPIVFFRHPFFPRKYAYADRLIADWNLNVVSDIPPIGCSMTKGNGLLEVVNHYPFGGDKNLMLPVGWLPHDKHPTWLCGRDDLFFRPTGTFDWRWDVAFMGHKGNDTDAVQGEISLKVDINHVPNGCSTAYPLRGFTDADVWEFIEKNNIPVHTERYEKVDGAWRTKPEKHFDPDYFPYCNRCLDRDGPVAVTCPKNGKEITNIGSQLQYFNHKQMHRYFGESAVPANN